jgi:prepilin-type N-terminal cleavage/methylation domain-containing protein
MMDLFYKIQSILYFNDLLADLRATRTPKMTGFTLIETLVAITVLTVALAAPLTLAFQSLSAAYTARDQVTAFHLAQEAVEAVRAQRDHNILDNLKNGPNTDWLDGLIVETIGDPAKPFMVDTLSTNNNFTSCGNSNPNSCDSLLFDSANGFYGHDMNMADPDISESRFKRYVRITEVPDTNLEEVRVRVVVRWRSGAMGTRRVVVEENIYNWISGITTP